MSQALNCALVEGAAKISALQQDWQALSLESGSSDLFLSYRWFDAWRAVFGSRARHGVVTIRHKTKLVGIMPIMIGQVWRSPRMEVRHDYMAGDHKFLTTRPRFRFLPVRQLSPILGLEPTLWRGSPLTARGEEMRCWEALLRFFRDSLVWDIAVLPLPQMLASSLKQYSDTIGIAARIDRLDRPMYLRTELPPWAAFLKSKQSQFRKGYAKALRRAEKEGLSYQTYAGQEEAGRGLAILSDVAARSWKASGRKGQGVVVPYTAASRRFFESLCRDSHDMVPVVSVIVQGTTPMAALFSVALGHRLVTLLTFFDASIKTVSVGRLLIKMAYEWAVDHGITEIDFNSNNPFAAIYADHHEIYHNFILLNDSPYGHLIQLLSRLSRRRGASEAPAKSGPCQQVINP
jgi:CelD/BcsL family acetyltransferase involved in cellulose biosynthesis